MTPPETKSSAPTPTAAAEMAVPVRTDCLAGVLDLERRMLRAETRALETGRNELRGLIRALPRLQDLIALPRQRFDSVSDKLARALARAAEVKRARLNRVEGQLSTRLIRFKIGEGRKRLGQLDGRSKLAERRHLADLARRLDGMGKLLQSYSYQGVLERGFAVVRDAAGKPVRGSAGRSRGEALEIEFARGDRLGVTVSDHAPEKPKPAPRGKPSATGGKQGSLL
jgi:exodeoxyribonuclease VII large subunit